MSFPMGGADITAGIDKVAANDIDLKKLVRKPAAIPQAETVVSGATNEAISAFVASRETPAVPVPDSGVFARFRRFWRP